MSTPELHSTAAAPPPMVLHVRVVTETGGGPEKTILNSPRYLAGLGYASRCAYLHPPNDQGFAVIRRNAERCQAPLDAISDRGPWDLGVARKLLRLCREHEVRIWHGHDYKSNLLGVILSRVWPMQLVTTVHGWVRFSRRTPLYYALDGASLRFFHRVVCVSPDLYERCRSMGVRPTRCVLIENAIDCEAFRRTMPTPAAKQEMGIPPGRLVIGAVGRLSAEKRFSDLIHIVRRLLLDGHDCELWIIGDGAERPRLGSLISDTGLQDRVRLFGYRSDVVDLLQAMDVLAVYSVREGLPNAVLEAMACEVPVVATNVGGIPRAVAHEVSGLVVDKDDVHGFQTALASLLGDPAMRYTLSRAARRTIEQRYSFKARMQRIAAVYDQLLAPDPRGARLHSAESG